MLCNSRLFAHEKIYEKVTEGVAEIAKNIKVDQECMIKMDHRWDL